MKATIEKIEQIREHGYKLDFGEVLEQTFVNYKKIILISTLVIFVFSCMIFGVILAISLAFAGIDSYSKILTGYQSGDISTTALIVQILVTVIASAIMAPLTAGLLKIAHLAHHNKEFTFSTAFDHYKSKYVKDIIVSTVIISFASQAIATIFNLLTLSNNDFSWLFSTIVTVIGLLISLFTYLVIPMIIFGDLSAAEAIKSSITVVSKRFWIILALLIVSVICVFLGLFGFCLGILFTVPILFSLQYTIYRNAIGVEEIDEIDEIGFNSENY